MHDRRGARWRHRVPVALGLLAVVAACGGDEPPPTAAEVAEGVCGASIRWRDDLGDLVEDLSRTGVRLDDVGERKELLLRYVDDAEERTGKLVDDVRDAGVDGPVEDALVQGASEIDAIWDRAREAAEAFPDDEDDEPFASRGFVLLHFTEQTASAWKTAMRTAVDAADADLAAAFADEPSCSVIPRTADR